MLAELNIQPSPYRGCRPLLSLGPKGVKMGQVALAWSLQTINSMAHAEWGLSIKKTANYIGNGLCIIGERDGCVNVCNAYF